jgi:hypothetical protein
VSAKSGESCLEAGWVGRLANSESDVDECESERLPSYT